MDLAAVAGRARRCHALCLFAARDSDPAAPPSFVARRNLSRFALPPAGVQQRREASPRGSSDGERGSGAKCFHSPSSGRSKSASGSIESGCWRENRACASCLICLTLISEFSRMWYLNLDNNILCQHFIRQWRLAVRTDGVR